MSFNNHIKCKGGEGVSLYFLDSVNVTSSEVAEVSSSRAWILCWYFPSTMGAFWRDGKTRHYVGTLNKNFHMLSVVYKQHIIRFKSELKHSNKDGFFKGCAHEVKIPKSWTGFKQSQTYLSYLIQFSM